jgi:hypothetical protein
VGSQTNDYVGSNGLALNNGNFVVLSNSWNNAGLSSAGAATWRNGNLGTSGGVNPSNSLVGSHAGDSVGIFGGALTNGDYVVRSPFWDNGNATDVGAITWAFVASGLAGPINGNNSVIGDATGGGSSMVFAYDQVNNQLVVGRPADNLVTLFRPPYPQYLPVVRK